MYWARFYRAFSEIGYEVKDQELLAADFGTPQMRRRLIFVATKGENTFKFPNPSFAENEDIFGLPRYNGAGDSMTHLPEPLIQGSKPNKAMELTSIPLHSVAHLDDMRKSVKE